MKFSWCMICLAALAVPSVARAQVEGLPIKPGLWENTANMKSGPGGGRTITRQVCYSAKMTVDQYVAQLAQQTPGFQCTFSNQKVTAHNISMDQVCSGQGMNAKSHFDVSMPDPEHMISNSHMEMSGSVQGRPMDMKMDSAITGKFISSDCGSVKPLALPTGPPK
jgi:hypothetical protein